MEKRQQILNSIKVVLSTIVVYIPYLIFCYFFEYRLPSFFMTLISIFFISYILEHFYRKLSAAVISSDERCWGNWFAPHFLGRTMAIVAFSVVIRWVAGIIIANLVLEDQVVLSTLSFITYFISYFITCLSYTAFLAYSAENESFLNGISKGITFACDNIVFFTIAAFILFLVSNIPVIGYTSMLLLFVATEFVKMRMYADYYDLFGYNEEDEFFDY